MSIGTSECKSRTKIGGKCQNLSSQAAFGNAKIGILYIANYSYWKEFNLDYQIFPICMCT